MKQFFRFWFICGLVFLASLNSCSQGYEKLKNSLIIAEQSEHRIIIADVNTGTITWDWRASESNIKPEHVKWFNNPSDAKVVYDGDYVLMCASGGGCALIRISDRKTLFYAWGGVNPHSIEVLPDGNIVCASSTDNRLTVFKTDTTSSPENVISRSFHNLFAHNAVWDKKRNLLWTGCMDKIISYRYNFSCSDPVLTPVDSLAFDDRSGHDLFPVPGEDALFFTAHENLWKYDIEKKELFIIPTQYKNIKSVSSQGAGKVPVINTPKEQWWTDEIIDLNGNSVFGKPGLKIYKARWAVYNTFSYKPGDKFKMCR